MTILREDANDLGKLDDKEVAKVVEEFEARLKHLQENHTKELEAVRSTLSDNHNKELEYLNLLFFRRQCLSIHFRSNSVLGV